MLRPRGVRRSSACALISLAALTSVIVPVADGATGSDQAADVESVVVVPLTVTAQPTIEILDANTGYGELQQPDELQPWAEEPYPDAVWHGEASEPWTLQWLPPGLIYHSYMAGVHEPRLGIVAFHEGDSRTLWDATLGGRVGLVRYGDCDPLQPHGFELDFYGASISRLDVEHSQDLDSTDYVFGFPLTYGVGASQYKLGYAHLSSHLGDELAIREPATLERRRNYVRDSVVLGLSHYPYPVWRLYGEVGWAFHHSGGAQPWESQFGTELSSPKPTGRRLTPFFAVNARLREEHDFGGDMAAQLGWLRRGEYGQTLRIGAQYYNGKSSQMQFFNQAEEQIGLGLWYDF